MNAKRNQILFNKLAKFAPYINEGYAKDSQGAYICNVLFINLEDGSQKAVAMEDRQGFEYSWEMILEDAGL